MGGHDIFPATDLIWRRLLTRQTGRRGTDPSCLSSLASQGGISLFSDLITLVLFAKGFLVGCLMFFRELVFCYRAITQLNSIHHARTLDSESSITCKCRIFELSQQVHHILHWCFIPYMIKHFIWRRDNGERRKIEGLLIQVQEIANSRNDPCTKSVFQVVASKFEPWRD